MSKVTEAATCRYIHCPACKAIHAIGMSWQYNGNPDSPTFSPSLLVTSGHHDSQHRAGDPCWCTFNVANPGECDFKCFRCHSFVTDGKIQFLDDCSHELAGQTVDLPEMT